MLNSIVIKLPIGQEAWNTNFTQDFVHLLQTCHNVQKKSDSQLILGNPKLSPHLAIQLNSQSSSVSFNDDSQHTIQYQSQGLTFGTNLKSENPCKEQLPQPFTIRTDQFGEYFEYANKQLAERQYQLPLASFLKRSDQQLIEVNHIGINFSPDAISPEEYSQFKSNLAQNTFLVKYPTDDEWPFIIPATQQEFESGITNFNLARNPKFEIVYSSYHHDPVIQFDIESKLTRSQIYELLPAPYGISYPGLEDFFRTVFIATDFPGIIIRFDIRFPNPNNHDFYPWMIKEGGRIS